MIHQSHIVAADNLIAKYGRPFSVETGYSVTLASDIGDLTITLSETFGLQEGHQLETGSETITIASISGETINLVEPLTAKVEIGIKLTGSVDTLCVQAPVGRSITRDTLEFNKRVRVPKGTLVNYGSKVHYIEKDFFVTGFDLSDLTLSLKLRAIDGLVTLQRLSPGDFNGFGYTDTPVNIGEDVPAYFEHVSSQIRLMDGAGYVPTTYQLVAIPADYDMEIGDRVLRGDDVLKVIGLDRFRLKNLLTLIVDYDSARE